MAIRIVTVDAFTNVPFAGNPAAVCVLPERRPDEWLRHVAREMNLSDTAFLVRRDGEFNLRWLTPTVEVDLCGHATLASAHVLWEDGHLPADAQARFHTRSGLLTADRRGEWIELDFPVKEAVAAEPPSSLLTRSGRKALFAGTDVCRSVDRHGTAARVIVEATDHQNSVRSVSHTPRNPGATPPFTGTQRGTLMLREVVDGNCVDAIWCASARASGTNFQACSFNHSDISPL